VKRAKSGRIKDAFGHWFDVSSFRGTRHGFDVVLGWPSGKKRGPGGAGRPGVIFTKPLVLYLEQFRTNMKGIDLPISSVTIVRLRQRLGHHAWREMQRWWEDRNTDLKALSYTEFAMRHGRTPSAAARQGARLNGTRHRQKLWWTAPEVVSALSSEQPDSEVAADLGISPNSLRRLRSKCREMGVGGNGSFAPRIRPRGWWQAPEVQTVLQSGKTYKQMARTLRVGMSALNSIIRQSRRAGLGPPRRQKRRRNAAFHGCSE
jgi:hypothetical protein